MTHHFAQQTLLTGHFLLVSLQREHLLHHPNVKYLYQTILGSRQQPISILVPLDAMNSGLVDVAATIQNTIFRFDSSEAATKNKKKLTEWIFLGRFWHPRVSLVAGSLCFQMRLSFSSDANQRIWHRSRDLEGGAGGVIGDIWSRGTMWLGLCTSEDELLSTSDEVKSPDSTVVRASDEFCIRRGKTASRITHSIEGVCVQTSKHIHSQSSCFSGERVLSFFPVWSAPQKANLIWYPTLIHYVHNTSIQNIFIITLQWLHAFFPIATQHHLYYHTPWIIFQFAILKFNHNVIANTANNDYDITTSTLHTPTPMLTNTCASSVSDHMTSNCTIPPATLDWLSMCLESVDIVKVGLPVLDKAPVIGRHHPDAIVAPYHAANGAVMTLNKAHRHNTMPSLVTLFFF